MNSFLILLGKLLSSFSRVAGLGNGSTWPGHIALNFNKNFIKDILAKNPKLKIVLIAGTNGKTTTSKLIRTILEHQKIRAIHNESGANLVNGITSTLIQNASISGKILGEFAIFEVDENSLPLVLNQLAPQFLILLNLFRDQLDRYGEVNNIATKWSSAIKNLPETTTLILNADDPQVAFLGSERKNVLYFGLNEKTNIKTPSHASDSTYCPTCSTKLSYASISFSHLGDWKCPKCKNKRPTLSISSFSSYPLPGIYNKYNVLAAVLLAKANNTNTETIEQSLKEFKPAFGRQEILEKDGKKIQIFLSKNPTSFNQSLRTISELNAKHLLIILNDRIPDGRDISWIWDVDFEEFLNDTLTISCSGDRAFDMAVRLKYAHPKILKVNTYFPDLEEGIRAALENVPQNETLYILPTYSAMLEVRKILTGKKIL